MFWWREEFGEPDSVIGVGFTDASLDLAEASPRRAHSERVLADAVGARVVRLEQVHGAEVATIDASDVDPASTTVPVADAAVSGTPGVALVARAADCVPVALVDLEARLIGVVHSGRRGTELDVAGAAVRVLGERGARRIRAWVGPHICGSCYEVPDTMRAEVAALVPEAWATTSWGTPALDLGAAVVAQLERAGAEVTVVAGCTREESGLHSHRRDAAAAGRFAAVAWLGRTPETGSAR